MADLNDYERPSKDCPFKVNNIEECDAKRFTVKRIEEDGISVPMEAHQLERDKDGFLVGDVSDLSEYLPFLIHDSESDTLEEVDADNLIDWSSDIDTKPQYDKIYSKR